MTAIGKILAFLNLAVGLGLAMWSVNVYTNRPSWFDAPADVVDKGNSPVTFTQLKGEYFGDANLTNLVLTRYDSKIDFAWSDGSPDPALPANNFSVRWTGKLQPPRSGAYLFTTWSDDGVRLWIDGQLAVDAWFPQILTRHTWLTYLSDDRTYDIKLATA